MSESGIFDVYNGSKHESSFGPGVAFGELAVLYNIRRSRSIDGTVNCFFFSILFSEKL